MKKIKSILIRFIFIALCCFGTQVYAGLFGWQTKVQALDGTTIHSQQVTGPTFSSCEFKRADAINTFISLGYIIISDPHCRPTPFRFELPILYEKERFPWPWPGPVCLSCPYLNVDNINIIYPGDFVRVNKLMKEYNIDAYNKDLLDLQGQYDLQGFEEEMIKMEMEVEMEKINRQNMDMRKLPTHYRK